MRHASARNFVRRANPAPLRQCPVAVARPDRRVSRLEPRRQASRYDAMDWKKRPVPEVVCVKFSKLVELVFLGQKV